MSKDMPEEPQLSSKNADQSNSSIWRWCGGERGSNDVLIASEC